MTYAQPFYTGELVWYRHSMLERDFAGKVTNVTKRRIEVTLEEPPAGVEPVRSFTWAAAADQLRYRGTTRKEANR